MKYFLFLAAILAVTTAMSVKMAPLLAEDSQTAVESEYIVIFNNEVTEEKVRQHHVFLAEQLALYEKPEENKVLHTYHIGTFRGYGVKTNDELRDKIRMMPEVRYVERNQEVKAYQGTQCTVQSGATWGIVRTVSRDNPRGNTNYEYDDKCDGEGVTAYIVDTGIETTHPEFGGRAEWGYDAVDTPSPGTDENGHGTHVAGTVMSNTYGLARKGTAIAVKVLNRNGSGTYDQVIAGVDFTARDHTQNGRRSVANMSLGGGRSTALNEAVEKAVEAGVHFVVAAGNEGQDGCNVSPASSGAITAAASDSSDQFAYFSNWGDCVEMIAPGVDVTAPWINGGISTISGTSMASPHIAGVIAKYITGPECTEGRDIDQSQDAVLEYIEEKATRDAISGVRGTTPNLLIFMDCE